MNNLFSISNIAWDQHNDPKILQLLASYGVNAIEIAPSKVWHDLENVTEKEAVSYRKFLADQGFAISQIFSRSRFCHTGISSNIIRVSAPADI